MELARSSVLHESALKAIRELEDEKGFWRSTPEGNERRDLLIQRIKEGKPFPNEPTVHYLSRRCWELSEAIYALQLQHVSEPVPNFGIEVERLKSHLETARTLLGKPDIRVTVNNNISLTFIDLTIAL